MRPGAPMGRRRLTPKWDLLPPPQHVLHRRGRLAPKARYHVGVGVEGRRDIGMSQKLLDELGMHPLGEKEARTGVPEIMEGDSREPRPFQQWPPGTVD